MPVFAQGTVTSISITPTNPTTTDTIKAYVTCTFSSGGCNAIFDTMTQSGNTIAAAALHCPGMLAVICSYTDTFIIAPQPAGPYTFKFSLYSRNPVSSMPCGTYLYVVDSSSRSFTVQGSSTSVSTVFPGNGKLWYNQKQLHLKVDAATANSYKLRVTNTAGQVLIDKQVSAAQSNYPLDVPGGIYIVSLSSPGNTYTRKILVQ